ncbi:hypothetical protein RFI_07290, partial [Reticulomyxa filosa]
MTQPKGTNGHTITTPSGSKLNEWWYKDPQGVVQGPFSAAQMNQWFFAKYFKKELPICCHNNGHFAELQEWFIHSNPGLFVFCKREMNKKAHYVPAFWPVENERVLVHKNKVDVTRENIEHEYHFNGSASIEKDENNDDLSTGHAIDGYDTKREYLDKSIHTDNHNRGKTSQ